MMEPAFRQPKSFHRLAILPTTRSAVIGVAFIIFIGLCVLPVVYMIGVSLVNAHGVVTFENYRRLLGEPRQRELLMNSTLLGAYSAALATLLGAPLGLLLARAHLPAKRLLRIALIIPLIIPPYVLALAWILFTGSTGLLARVIGRDLFSGWTYSFAGAVVVLSLAYYPLSMLVTEAAARRVDGHLEEAALLVTDKRWVLWRITMPLISSMVAAAALTMFVLGLSATKRKAAKKAAKKRVAKKATRRKAAKKGAATKKRKATKRRKAAKKSPAKRATKRTTRKRTAKKR